ncbi:MAG: efflux RND transporter periplasmic adaptor subunit [Polaromonas sp.]|nr:efflux RND transporter periplasmic adaptor subunit [Polaromonas sp.]
MQTTYRSPLNKWLGLALLLGAMGAQARTFSGLVYPLHDITLSAGVAGLVMQRVVVPGQQVRQGQVLLLLDDRLQTIESDRRKVIFEDQSELVAARERSAIQATLLADATAVYKTSGSISKDELLRLQAEASAASGRLSQLIIQKKRERLDYDSAERERLQRHITAPIGGIVTKIIPQMGEWAKPGDPIIMLVDASTAELHVAVPHQETIGLKVGAAQTIAFEAGSGAPSLTGRISFISAVADPASGLVEMKISFANPRLLVKPGIKGSIDLKSNGPKN